MRESYVLGLSQTAFHRIAYTEWGDADNPRVLVCVYGLQEMKRLKKALPESEYQQLRGVMWALRKKPTDLNDKERAALALLFKYSPLLQQAYEKERALTGIFDDPISKRQAREEAAEAARRLFARAQQVNDRDDRAARPQPAV